MPPELLRLTPERIYARTLLGCAEMLRTGTTTAVDDVNLSPTLDETSMAAVVQAYEDSGMRAVVSAHILDVPYHRTVSFVADRLPMALRDELERAPIPDAKAIAEFARACAKRWNQPGRRVGFGVGPSGPQRGSDRQLEAIATVAEECDLPIYIHLLETRTQAVIGQVRHGKTLVERLRDLRFLSPRVTLGHAVWVTPGDIEIISAAGAMPVTCRSATWSSEAGSLRRRVCSEPGSPWRSDPQTATGGNRAWSPRCSVGSAAGSVTAMGVADGSCHMKGVEQERLGPPRLTTDVEGTVAWAVRHGFQRSGRAGRNDPVELVVTSSTGTQAASTR